MKTLRRTFYFIRCTNIIVLFTNEQTHYIILDVYLDETRSSKLTNAFTRRVTGFVDDRLAS